MNDEKLNSMSAIGRAIPSNFSISVYHLSELLQTGRLNLWELDLASGAVVDFGYSESLSSMAGYTLGDDTLETFFNRVHPDDIESVKSALAISRENLEDYVAEFRIKLLNGTCEWVLAHGRYIFDMNQNPIKMMGTWKFTTEEKIRQERLYNQRITLDRISRALFAGELTSTVTHQIAQPVSALDAYISGGLRRIMQNDLAHKDLISLFESAKTQVDLINKAIKRIKRFIIHGELKYQPVNVEQMVASALSLMIMPADTKIQINCHVEPGLPEVQLDYYQIKQVLQNLVYNSIEALMLANYASPMINIEVTAANHHLHFSIEDNGPGISNEALQHLFTPFFSSKSDGMGIGLVLCRKIIEQHGGQMSLMRGMNDRGTIVKFTLPMKEENT